MKTRTMLLVVGLIAVLAVAGGAVYLVSSQTGTLVMGVTDSPLNSNATHVYLTITGVTLQGNGNSSTTYNMNSTRFDLLTLTNVTKFLGSQAVPVGNYP